MRGVLYDQLDQVTLIVLTAWVTLSRLLGVTTVRSIMGVGVL